MKDVTLGTMAFYKCKSNTGCGDSCQKTEEHGHFGLVTQIEKREYTNRENKREIYFLYTVAWNDGIENIYNSEESDHIIESIDNFDYKKQSSDINCAVFLV